MRKSNTIVTNRLCANGIGVKNGRAHIVRYSGQYGVIFTQGRAQFINRHRDIAVVALHVVMFLQLCLDTGGPFAGDKDFCFAHSAAKLA